MGTHYEPDGSAIDDGYPNALGRVKVYFTLEITHEDGTVTKQQCVGALTENVDG